MKFIFPFLALLPVSIYGAPILGIDNVNTESHGYIVVLKKGISAEAFTSHVSSAKASLQAKSFDVGGFKGYSIRASKAEALALAKTEEVDYIEADQTFTIASPTPQLTTRNVQANAPWGLGRISHRAKGSTDYVFTPTTGTFIYVLDTGVRTTHQKFEGRASNGFNAVGGSFDDVVGHGTHIAGTASSQTYGVTRFANIISVKVLGDTGSSSTSIIISGINWAVQDMQAKGRVGKTTAVLAVGGAFSAALNNAVAAASNVGLFLAVAAGSENTSGNGSPSSEPTACVAGATTIDDAKAPYSNYGPSVDIYAPGSNTISLWITSDTAVTTLSGTSSAAAHIAGLGAYILALEGPRGAVALCERLREIATKDVLSGIPAGSSNLLAYNLSGL